LREPDHIRCRSDFQLDVRSSAALVEGWIFVSSCSRGE
jgi:hypothetical protein